MSKKIEILDSTLRDGAQGEGISFSVSDKINILKALDSLGISFIEAGNPASNPKDMEFFSKIKDITLKNAKLVAFGSTRRKHTSVEQDEGLKSLLSANTEAVAIFGKSWLLHVNEIIKVSKEENLAMIKETIEYLKKANKFVIYDAEHFYDGFKDNADYALETIKTAFNSGADRIVLCDTNGSTLPDDAFEITLKAVEFLPDANLGVHFHNDIDCAVSNSILAAKAGANHIQGTYLGFGERCGNANLSAIIPNLQLKMGFDCIGEKNIAKLSSTAGYIAEISNITLPNNTPYVGKSAFAHKGGMHVDGINKNAISFEHISPHLVGNKRNILLSEFSGKAAISKIMNLIDASETEKELIIKDILDEVKYRELLGYTYESASASLELLILKKLGKYKPAFELVNFKTISELVVDDNPESATVMIKVNVNGKLQITASDGQGPIDAMDKALRRVLEEFYPVLKQVRLTDYKVRVIDSGLAAAAEVRVIIESTDGKSTWCTVGKSFDIINASWEALRDSIEYKLLKDKLVV